MFPMMTNCLFNGSIHASNSRKREKGGLVMITSASSRSCRTSSLWKSPSPSKISLFQISQVYTIIACYIPSQRIDFSFNLGLGRVELRAFQFKECRLFIYLNEFAFWCVTSVMSFFSLVLKFCAKYLVKLLHSGSSHGRRMVLLANTPGSDWTGVDPLKCFSTEYRTRRSLLVLLGIVFR